jgi:hypothetical protein
VISIFGKNTTVFATTVTRSDGQPGGRTDIAFHLFRTKQSRNKIAGGAAGVKGKTNTRGNATPNTTQARSKTSGRAWQQNGRSSLVARDGRRCTHVASVVADDKEPRGREEASARRSAATRRDARCAEPVRSVGNCQAAWCVVVVFNRLFVWVCFFQFQT